MLARWPRRLTAVACLLLAAASAVAERNTSSAATAPHPARTAPHNPADSLSAGQVAVPVHLAGAGRFIRVGDRIGLVFGPAPPETPAASVTDGGAPGGEPPLDVDGLLVLAVLGPGSTAFTPDGTDLLVAADRPTARRIATLGERHILAVLDKSP